MATTLLRFPKHLLTPATEFLLGPHTGAVGIPDALVYNYADGGMSMIHAPSTAGPTGSASYVVYVRDPSGEITTFIPNHQTGGFIVAHPQGLIHGPPNSGEHVQAMVNHFHPTDGGGAVTEMFNHAKQLFKEAKPSWPKRPQPKPAAKDEEKDDDEEEEEESEEEEEEAVEEETKSAPKQSARGTVSRAPNAPFTTRNLNKDDGSSNFLRLSLTAPKEDTST